MFLKEWLDGFPAIIVQGHANGGKPALFVFVLELHVPGNFVFASRTPGSPKIQQHDAAFVTGQFDERASRVFEVEVRGDFPGISGR